MGDAAGSGNTRHRTLLRACVVLISITLVVLWVLLVWCLYERAEGQPAPAVFMMPILFVSLAVAGARGLLLMRAGGGEPG